MKLNINEMERTGPRIKAKKHIKEAINTDEIKLVITNTINTYFNIFPSLFKLTILAILLEIVKNTRGTTIT